MSFWLDGCRNPAGGAPQNHRPNASQRLLRRRRRPGRPGTPGGLTTADSLPSCSAPFKAAAWPETNSGHSCQSRSCPRWNVATDRGAPRLGPGLVGPEEGNLPVFEEQPASLPRPRQLRSWLRGKGKRKTRKKEDGGRLGTLFSPAAKDAGRSHCRSRGHRLHPGTQHDTAPRRVDDRRHETIHTLPMATRAEQVFLLSNDPGTDKTLPPPPLHPPPEAPFQRALFPPLAKGTMALETQHASSHTA
ncbi:hypothetical protein CDD83_9624 [Cordyceps sp. RAO-2017]|nr:hypothetical protein CDD83_9624 [Cordyceps sp. RAO-2017]